MPIDDYNKKVSVLTELLQGKIKSYSIEHRVIKNDGRQMGFIKRIACK